MLMTAYIGDNDVAHRVKKMYVGDSTGVARCMYNPELDRVIESSITKVSKAISLSEQIRHPLGTNTGNYAIFAEAYISDAFNTNFVRTSFDSTESYKISNTDCGSIGEYGVYVGGTDNNMGYTAIYVAFAYDKNLTRRSISALNSARSGMGIGVISNCLLFAGGYGHHSVWYSTVDYYSNNLTHGTVSASLNSSRNDVGYANISDEYLLFAGGYNGSSYISTVEYYNKSLTKSSLSSLSINKSNSMGLSLSNYAIFGGGYNGTNNKKVDAYSINLVKTSITDLTEASYASGCGSIGDKGLIAGGYGNDSNYGSSNVDCYDNELVKTSLSGISARQDLGSIVIGNYILFAGGYEKYGSKDTIDVYYAETISSYK